MKPLIGIPARSQTVNDLAGDALPGTYSRAVERAGGAPILIPLRLGEESLRAILARVDGLLLVGGPDIHPSRYGETVEPFCGEIDLDRDAAELALTRSALESAMPILGMCRGIQTLNVAAGGSLYQDIAEQVPGALPHSHRKGDPYNRLVHTIDVDPDSILARALGATRLGVNSLHHQAVKEAAPGLRVVARAPDGIVEGLEARPNGFAVAVQFHPEWLLDDDARMLRLFQVFVQQAAERAPSG